MWTKVLGAAPPTPAAQEPTDGPLWQLIIGISLAILASTLIPWVTQQASAGIQSRRDRNNRRRELFEAAQLARLETRLSPRSSEASAGPSYDENMRELNRATVALRSTFGLFDGSVNATIRSWLQDDAAAEEVLRLWANGNRFTARWKARRLMDKSNTISPSPPQPQ